MMYEYLICQMVNEVLHHTGMIKLILLIRRSYRFLEGLGESRVKNY